MKAFFDGELPDDPQPYFYYLIALREHGDIREQSFDPLRISHHGLHS
jgi:hypothetical protein